MLAAQVTGKSSCWWTDVGFRGERYWWWTGVGFRGERYLGGGPVLVCEVRDIGRPTESKLIVEVTASNVNRQLVQFSVLQQGPSAQPK